MEHWKGLLHRNQKAQPLAANTLFLSTGPQYGPEAELLIYVPLHLFSSLVFTYNLGCLTRGRWNGGFVWWVCGHSFVFTLLFTGPFPRFCLRTRSAEKKTFEAPGFTVFTSISRSYSLEGISPPPAPRSPPSQLVFTPIHHCCFVVCFYQNPPSLMSMYIANVRF
jgi:hypothetical protein